MDWFVYWFMLPACIVIAATATFSGISGAALMTPLFLIGFPLLGVPQLSTVAAIGAALFLETSGFGMGVYHYARMRLIDLRTARGLMLATVPAAVLGAVLAHHAPVTLLRIGYGVTMLGVAWLLLRGDRATRFPVPIAAATSTLVVAATVLGAALTHLVELALHGGLAAIPWNLIVWGVPGAIIGATVGTRLQGRVGERATRRFFPALFAAIGVVFLLAFTMYAHRFAPT